MVGWCPFLGSAWAHFSERSSGNGPGGIGLMRDAPRGNGCQAGGKRPTPSGCPGPRSTRRYAESAVASSAQDSASICEKQPALSENRQYVSSGNARAEDEQGASQWRRERPVRFYPFLADPREGDRGTRTENMLRTGKRKAPPQFRRAGAATFLSETRPVSESFSVCKQWRRSRRGRAGRVSFCRSATHCWERS